MSSTTPPPPVSGRYTYASFPPESSSTLRRLLSIQARLRKPYSSSTGTTVTSRALVPSGFGPTLMTTDLPAVLSNGA